jgi:hypothetical protein
MVQVPGQQVAAKEDKGKDKSKTAEVGNAFLLS